MYPTFKYIGAYTACSFAKSDHSSSPIIFVLPSHKKLTLGPSLCAHQKGKGNLPPLLPVSHVSHKAHPKAHLSFPGPHLNLTEKLTFILYVPFTHFAHYAHYGIPDAM